MINMLRVTGYGLRVKRKKPGIMEEWNGETVRKKLGTSNVKSEKMNEGKVNSWGYQIVVQTPDFVIKGSLVMRDAL